MVLEATHVTVVMLAVMLKLQVSSRIRVPPGSTQGVGAMHEDKSTSFFVNPAWPRRFPL
jgi:hypothetical protein